MGEQNGAGLFAEERKRRIAIYVKQHGKVSVNELCAEFSVSPATMRNDLQVLHERRLLRRTHGGAMANIQANFEPSVNEKYDKCLAEKQTIARTALKYIREGDSIALDAGTTVFELAKLLGQFKNLRVVTYDLNIASYLDSNTQVSLFVAGGEVRGGHHYMIGNTALSALDNLHLDTFFIGANGIHAKAGITTPQLETAVIKKQLLFNSGQNILLADSSKIDNISFVKFAEAGDIDVFITDEKIDVETTAWMTAMGMKVEQANLESQDYFEG